MIFFIRNNEECACLKEQHLFETEIFCNIINVFTVILDQFNASLPKKTFKTDETDTTPAVTQMTVFFSNPQTTGVAVSQSLF